MTDEPLRAARDDAGAQGRFLALRAVFVRLRFLLLLGAIVLVAAFWGAGADRVDRWFSNEMPQAATAAAEFFCPMHPAVVRSEPARCPSCSMPLSQRDRGAGAQLPTGVLARVQLSPERVAQAGIRTEDVAWRPLVLEIRAGGVLRYDETKIRRFGAGFPGQVTSVEGTFDGATVARGRPLLRIASANLRSTLAAYVTSQRQLRDAESRSAAAGTERLRTQTETFRRQLLEWGLDREQLDLAEEAGEAGDDVAFRAPHDCVVLHCDVVAGQQVVAGTSLVHIADPRALVAIVDVRRMAASQVRAGQEAVLVDPSAPERSVAGTVVHVAPHLEERAQSVGVRVSVPATDGGPRPGTQVAARLRVPLASIEPWKSSPRPQAGPARTVYVCPMHEVTRDQPGICEACGAMKLIEKQVPAGPGPDDVLSLPQAAVIDTGQRRVVFVESEPGVFEAREVVLGPRVGAYFPVIAGIEAGARVAAAGAFLLDAETRLDPAAAATYFGASTAPSSSGSPR